MSFPSLKDQQPPLMWSYCISRAGSVKLNTTLFPLLRGNCMAHFPILNGNSEDAADYQDLTYFTWNVQHYIHDSTRDPC